MLSHRLLLLVAFCGVMAPTPSIAEPDDAAAPGARAATAGSWAHVDPQTGQRLPGPPPGVVIPPNPAFSTSHQGLVEKPAPGGGVMIDLQRRFRSAATATVGADGKPDVDCVPPGTVGKE